MAKEKKQQKEAVINPCSLCKGCLAKQQEGLCNSCASSCGGCCQIKTEYDVYDSVVVASYDPNEDKE